jgi:hypothetical protein
VSDRSDDDGYVAVREVVPPCLGELTVFPTMVFCGLVALATGGLARYVPFATALGAEQAVLRPWPNCGGALTLDSRKNTSEPGYQYDVFLSYRRANQWPRFVDAIFVPMFRHWLEAEIGQPPRIFFDVEDIETGESWPRRLAMGIAQSKVMVCLWSNEYFRSSWCQAELGQMLARREIAKARSGPLPLVLAVVIHDGESISPSLNDIQRMPIQEYANPWLARDSPRAEELSERIRKFCIHVAHALTKVPECDPSWTDLISDDFVHLFARQASQREVPSLGREVA